MLATEIRGNPSAHDGANNNPKLRRGNIIQFIAALFVIFSVINSTLDIMKASATTTVGPAQVLITCFIWFGLGVFLRLPKNDDDV